MGIIVSVKPILSYAETESGKLVIWHDKVINNLLQRAIRAERRGDDFPLKTSHPNPSYHLCPALQILRR